ncbi:phosphotransferase family protein [Pseudaestuariivita rosea]|uniref:phosphotransferase family protein n=1 Tax=Pseudaestuariivita rosea TaxID=2763263 RepID=UPI001ABAEE2C|nr:phosphotransferase family protein [Pseudaestuariivita rosea]
MDETKAQAALNMVMDAAPQVSAIKKLDGGVSNFTYLVETDDKPLILRTPPPGARSGNAHNMVREARVLQAVHPVFALAPKAIGSSDDPSATGDSFFIMEKREGLILKPGQKLDITPEQASALCDSFVDVFATLHEAPIPDTARDIFGDPDGFVARQVAGWTKRYHKLGLAEDFTDLVDWLDQNQPPPSPHTSLLHNDFKFDNMVLNPDDPTRIIGLLDWELAGRGDPLMDLGNALAYWIEAADPPTAHQFKRGPTDIPGMMTREDLIDAYCARRGFERPESMTFYQAMGLFRLAIIALQVHVRFAGGPDVQGPFRDAGIMLLGRATDLTKG